MIILWFLGIIVFVVVITVLINVFKNWKSMINYKNLFTFFTIGTIFLILLFSFVIEDTLFRIFLSITLIISSLFYGAFKK